VTLDPLAVAQIRFLGKPALYVAGRLQPFGGPRKAIALLAYLLLYRDRALSRAAVAEKFWPDEDDENARTALRRHLHRALAALPEALPARPWVIADRTTLRWNLEAPIEIDTVEYERLCAAGAGAAAALLYRGDYVEDFYDEWILPERERLREQHSANLVALVDERRRALDYPAAIAFAQQLLRLDSLREDTVRRLMSLHFAAGDRSGALATFESFRKRLGDELSADPMPETIALHEAIRGNELATVENVPPAPHLARAGSPFAGRQAALQSLRDAWETAARGAGSTVVVSGEAGVGKSRLIGELLALGEAQGARIALGSTASQETQPYQPIAEAMRGALRLLRLERLEPAKLAALSALVPDIPGLVPNVPVLVALEPERDRIRLFDAVASALKNLAETRPLLLVLEDLHWAGAATIELLVFLSRQLRAHSILVVVSFREEVNAGDALRGFLRRLELHRSSHVALGPLDVEDIRALIAAAAPEASETLAAEIFAASNGNALFATELLRDRLRSAGAGTDSAAVVAPAGLAATVVSRVERLSPAARAFAELASVAGVGFDVDVVREASGWSFAEVYDALDELLDQALVRESPQRRGEVAFSHQLVHAAVYGMLDDTVRRRFHGRVAKTMQRILVHHPSLYATVARHYDAGGFAVDALGNYLEAARYALEVFAYGDVLALATRALEICANANDRFELHRLREQAAMRVGDNATRRADCEAMTSIAKSLGDDELLGTALCRTAAMCMALREGVGEAVTIARLTELGKRVRSPRWGVEAALARARSEINSGAPSGAAAGLLDVEPLVAMLENDDPVCEYWRLRAYAAIATAPREAHAYLENASRCAGDNRIRSILVLRAKAHLADHEGEPRVLDRLATQLLELYGEIGDVEGQANAHQNLGLSAWYRCDVGSAREHHRLALAFFERVQKPQSIASVLINRGVLAQHTGDFDRAEADYLQAIAITEMHGPNPACLARANLASLGSMRGDHALARTLALDAATLARGAQLDAEEHVALEYLGIAERELGDVESARGRFETVLEYRRGHDPRGALETLIETIPAYLSLGACTEAVAAAAELLRILGRDRMRATFPAHAFWVAGIAYEAGGDAARGATLQAEARSLLRELAARLPDEATRAGYLSLPFHRLVLGQGDAD